MSSNNNRLILVGREPTPWLICDLVQKPVTDWLLIDVDERDRLLGVYRCRLCDSDAVNAMICPECDKYFCKSCLQRAFEWNGNSCPHCR